MKTPARDSTIRTGRGVAQHGPAGAWFRCPSLDQPAAADRARSWFSPLRPTSILL